MSCTMMPTVPPKQPPMVVEMAQRATTCQAALHQPVIFRMMLRMWSDAANGGGATCEFEV